MHRVTAANNHAHPNREQLIPPTKADRGNLGGALSESARPNGLFTGTVGSLIGKTRSPAALTRRA